MTRYWLPLTYQPKIQGVLDGTIRQTIRGGWKYSPGDRVAFHGWTGLPYRSPWSFRTEYHTLVEVLYAIVQDDGMTIISQLEPDFMATYPWDELDGMAIRDGIVPATGEGLRAVLQGMGCTGLAQVLRW